MSAILPVVPQQTEPPTSEILQDLASSYEGAVTVKDIVAAMGLRAHGIALILFSLPDAIPLPIPSLSTVLGIPLVLIAFHLVLFGEGSGLPQRAMKARIPLRAIKLLARFGVPFLRALEYVTRPRLNVVLSYERWIGLVCLYLSLLLLLPIPFVNFPPALCLLLIALGMVQRDGVVVLVGLAATAAMTFSIAFAANWLKDFVFGA
jgi:hypothetical protein